MTVLEATVEIVKAVLAPGGAGGNASHLLTGEKRKDLLEGIEALYKKLESLSQ